MRRRSFLWKLYLAFSVVIFLATASILLFTAQRIERNGRQAIEASLRTRALLMEDVARAGLAGGNADSLEARVRDLGQATGTRFTVIAADGRVLADSHEDPALMEPHDTRPEVLDARSRRTGQSVRFSKTLNQHMMYHALALRGHAGELVGYVRAALPLVEVDRQLDQLRHGVLLGALIGLLAALLIGWLIVRRLTRPLDEIGSSLQAFSAGDFSSRTHLARTDEFGELAAVMNAMAQELEERIARISEERNRLEAILAGMVEGVIAVDRQERILHINRVAARLLDMERAGSIGRPVWELARIPAVSEALSRCLKEQQQVEVEINRAAADGAERVIELYASPLPGNGSPGGAVLVLHEVTELRRLEHIRRDFVANVSHELKTPLTVIRGIVETMQDDPAMATDTRDRFLAKMKSQADYLAAQVSDLLALSRLESKRTHLDYERLDMNELARTTAAVRTPSAESREVKLELELGDAPVHVDGDRRALEQALGNLLDNAIQYTPAGGSVRLSVASQAGRALCAVTDTGIGIEPRHQERIFERFYRVDKARSREQGGTGLGLAIVKHVALAHDGAISLRSQPGRGSTFTLSLPLAD